MAAAATRFRDIISMEAAAIPAFLMIPVPIMSCMIWIGTTENCIICTIVMYAAVNLRVQMAAISTTKPGWCVERTAEQ